MTDIPKLKADAEERAFASFLDDAPLVEDVALETYRWALKRAITTRDAHIAASLSKEDGQKAFEEWFDPCNIGILGATDAMMRKMALAAWKAALHSCPYRAIIHNNENRGEGE